MFAKPIKLALAVTLAFSFNVAHASSKAPTSNSLQTVNSLSPNEKGFAYPIPSITEQDLIETGVLFVYNDNILNFFGNDPERLLEYVNESIEYNNVAFANSNIPVKRVVSGLVYADGVELPFWDNTATYNERLDALTALQSAPGGIALADNTQYSYLVGIVGFEVLENEAPIVGLSFLSGNASWISPYSNDNATWSSRTLAHELGHNDGFRHTGEDHNEHLEFLAREDATGFKCGNYASVMNVSGDRSEPFFSDTHISLHEHDHEVTCGIPNEANSAQVYRDLAQNNIANREGTFSNIKPTRPNTGFVSVYTNVESALEGQSVSFDVIFEGAEMGDSVNLVLRQGTAGLDDFDSRIIHITHNGRDNVYTVNVDTFTDTLSESTETLAAELIYPNGLSVVENNKMAHASIFDNDVQSSNDNSAALTTPQQGTNTSTVSTPTNNSAVSATSPAVNTAAPTNLNDSSGEASGGSFGIYSALLLALACVGRQRKG